MFDIGWSEMALILVVALVVIGPKDLPRVARQIGRWSAKARAMAREFQRSLDDMAREAELQDIKAEIEKASRGASGLGAGSRTRSTPTATCAARWSRPGSSRRGSTTSPAPH